MTSSNLIFRDEISQSAGLLPRFWQWSLAMILWLANCYGIGLFLDTLSWNLSYDILFPRNDGTWKSFQIGVVTGPILAASLTIGRYPLLRPRQLWRLGWLGLVLSWGMCLTWPALAILFPGFFIEIPANTLASPRRYILLTCFRDAILPALTFTVVIMLIYVLQHRNQLFRHTIAKTS